MKRDKNELFEQAKKIAVSETVIFVQDIIDKLPVSKSTFYEYYPDGSEELDTLKKILDTNKVAIKENLRYKWLHSDNATLQMALYKLTSNDEEHRKLQQNYISQETIHELKNTELIISGEKFALKNNEDNSK